MLCNIVIYQNHTTRPPVSFRVCGGARYDLIWDLLRDIACEHSF